MIIEFHGGPRDGEQRSITGMAPPEFRFPKSGYLTTDPQRYVAVTDVYRIRVSAPSRITVINRTFQEYDWQGQHIGY